LCFGHIGQMTTGKAANHMNAPSGREVNVRSHSYHAACANIVLRA
jgi:hypothetical protein